MSRHKIYALGTIMIFANKALLACGWETDVRICVEDGRISTLETQVKAHEGDALVDVLLPSIPNLHSHTFQRAMAGMTEVRATVRDSFWTWRKLMYRFMDRLTPEQIEAIAALSFMEMQEAGFASVAEFHYVHHQKGGVHYDDIAELSNRIYAASKLTGIGLTHLPVLYTYGGAEEVALAEGQLRFGNEVEAFERLYDKAQHGLYELPSDSNIGIAPHSLRAISPQSLEEILALHQSGPVHMHISEQPKEVSDVDAWLGARPVEWLLDNADVDKRWCLIHATHMTEQETLNMASSGAVVGLCPLTESNLGDGIYNGEVYLNAGGRFGIGTDSNILISVAQELRTIEYSQRLRDIQRNVMVVNEGSVGHTLYTNACLGGARALERDAGEIAVGKFADLVAIDSLQPALCALRDEQLLDGFIFAAKDNVISDLWSAGRHKIQAGCHINRDEIVSNYKKAVSSLLESI